MTVHTLQFTLFLVPGAETHPRRIRSTVLGSSGADWDPFKMFGPGAPSGKH